jgi:uncharacterized phiE125 gp8 family phage protein
MTKIRTVAPTVLAVDLAVAKANLRIDGSDMDALVTLWLRGIIASLEHEIGQCLMEQTWEVRLPGFPSIPCWRVGQRVASSVADEIRLPHPVMAVTSVKYLGTDGAEQVLGEGAYRLNASRFASTLSPARGASWPATAEDDAAVVIEVQCGYGDTPDKTPENVQLYILAKLVEQFDPATRTERDTVQSAFIDGLLDACRSHS